MGRFWNDPVSYTRSPIQAFLMFYLTDTTRTTAACGWFPAPI